MFFFLRVAAIIVLISSGNAAVPSTIARETDHPNEATATSLLALTTPIVQLSDCNGIWSITDFLLAYTKDSMIHTTSTTIAVSDNADKQFSTCQPPGRDHAESPNDFAFSPAVCPSGWTYYDMAAVSADEGRLSTAFCCASGFSLSTKNPYEKYSEASCYRTITPSETTVTATHSHGAGKKVFFTSGIMAHQAWAITWKESDQKSLSPSLPVLTDSVTVATWAPGQVTQAKKWTKRRDESPGLTGIFLFIVIFVPIMSVLLIVLTTWCCICYRRSKRQEAKERMDAIRLHDSLSAAAK